MALPKIQHPVFELTLPSNNKKVVFRPFLVREEKILLMAKQSDSEKDIIRAVKQIINNCIVNPQINVDELTSFDIEYFFLKLRSLSVDNIVTLSYKDFEDEKIYTVDVDLNKVGIKKDPTHTNKVKINNDLGLTLRYPSAEIYSKVSTQDKTEEEIANDLVRWCIESVYDTNTVYLLKDYSEQEVDEFIQNLDVNTLEKILNFFKTMPRLYYEVKWTNSLGHERTVELTSLSDFFVLG